MTAKTLSLAVSERGDVRLPRAYRRRYRVGRGERLRVVDVGGLLVLLPPTGRLPAFEDLLGLPGFTIHEPTAADLARARDLAHAKDVAVMAAAIGAGTPVLVTHNVKHFRAGAGVTVRRPRDYVADLRGRFGGLAGR